MLYYATRISENISKRDPEGYLICRNVPIARTGAQTYLAEELELDGDPDRRISVYRPEEEVFSKATMASFEGMPLTDDHPDESVNVDNINYLGVGHVENVRRGSGSESDMLIADLFITNQEVIEKVLNGDRREISCGYNYELSEEDGKYFQRQIRGNHIAIVDKGRAGHRVCIKDSFPKKGRRDAMNKTKSRASILSRMFASFARDAEPEEIAEAADAIQEIAAEPVQTDPDEAPKSATEATQDDGDDILAKIMDRLDAIEAKLNAPAVDEEPEVDPLEKLQNDLDEAEQEAVPPQFAEEDEGEEPEFLPQEEEDEEEELESHFVDPEQINEQDEDVSEVVAANAGNEMPLQADCRGRDSAAIAATRAAIRAVKPFINSLPKEQRKRASDSLVKALRKNAGLDSKAGTNGYLKIRKAKKASDKRADEKDLGRRIMEARNANAKK